MNPVMTQPGCEVDRPVKAHAANLKTILQAARCGNLGLLECQLKLTGEKVAVLTAFGRDGDETTLTPFAVLFNGNPYEMLNPPAPEGGFLESRPIEKPPPEPRG